MYVARQQPKNDTKKDKWWKLQIILFCAGVNDAASIDRLNANGLERRQADCPVVVSGCGARSKGRHEPDDDGKVGLEWSERINKPA